MTSKLKMIAMAAALSAGLAGVAVASPDGCGRGRGRMGGAERIQQRVERMRSDLGLSDEQARRIEQILTESASNGRGRWTDDRGERNGDFGAQDGDRDARREEMRQQRRQTMERINSVLTPEQRDRWAQLREQRKSEHGRRGEGRDRDQDRQEDRNF
jgi:Spy/CpxP family protein refolding chaperone